MWHKIRSFFGRFFGGAKQSQDRDPNSTNEDHDA